MRERSFLQELAGLIQSHAEGVKAMVQEARAGGQAQPEQAEGLGERGREPFGPPGATAGRDIDAADDAAAATAGTAEAGDQLESVTTRDDTEPAEAPATAIGEAVSVAPHTAPEVIDIPEAPEDRSELEETWAGSPDRLEEPAPVRFGSARAEGEEEDDARRKGARDNDSSLGDLFWGED